MKQEIKDELKSLLKIKLNAENLRNAAGMRNISGVSLEERLLIDLDYSRAQLLFEAADDAYREALLKAIKDDKP